MRSAAPSDPRPGRTSARPRAARRQISDHIPLGQPILVGHHSERRHRRDIERMDRLMQRRWSCRRWCATRSGGPTI
ncbi:DUF3560 domain-containing protein [Kribbella sp. VKM Ac-2568]|uniref:DUF3560 domain-containing protein n=1 Tax=Kribbella sp. VKM Ac-2568 TaxID=2512219 RepID=UPI00104CCE7F